MADETRMALAALLRKAEGEGARHGQDQQEPSVAPVR